MTETDKKALAYVLSILNRRRYTEHQITQKLLQRGYSESVISKVCIYCKERKYIDDYGFASSWIEDSINLNPKGRWRLSKELRERGVTEEIISAALENILPEEIEFNLAKALLSKRFSRIKSYQQKPSRLFYFMLRRGFSKRHIYQAAEELKINFHTNDLT